MMNKHEIKKKEQLGISPGSARNRLRTLLMFDMMQKLELDFCYRCKKKINSKDNLSIEHKIPWLDSDDPVGLYFDLDNIAFSHKKCNYSARRYTGYADGEKASTAKLTREKVLEIRKLFSAGIYTQIELAQMYEISQSQICRVVKFENWK